MNLIYDIGYNKGEFTKACFDRWKNIAVVAVEANPALCTFKTKPGIVLMNNLASDTNHDEVDFYVDPKSHGISTASVDFMANSRFKKGSKNLRRNYGRWGKPIKVKSVKLDKLIELYGIPDLIKIDVEGYEYKAIKGLTRKAKDICLEWHEEDYGSVLKIVAHLQSIGYTKFGVIGWFDEGDVFEKATFSSHGDPYLVYPKAFYEWGDLEMGLLINEDRRINYGMFFAKI